MSDIQIVTDGLQRSSGTVVVFLDLFVPEVADASADP